RDGREAVLAAFMHEVAGGDGKPGGKAAEIVGGDGHIPALLRSSRSRRSISFHSPSARNTKTATTLIPIAAMIAPNSAPSPRCVPHVPWHCSLTRVYPISPPARPPSNIATQAAMRALG